MNTLNQTPEHPPNEELAAFALGKETPNAQTIAEHIAKCSRCEILVANTPQDTFLGILNSAKPGQSLAGVFAAKSVTAHTDELPEELRRQTKYTFLKKLGGGGMGVVYLAEHNLMKRKVAVKLIPPEMIGNSAVRERFVQEVISAAALEHPNVVRAYSAEEFGAHMLFEMEFVDGKDLCQVVKSKGPLPVAHAVNYIRQAAQALQHAMLKRLIHRDIKPGNLMLTRAGSVKVADFGLAKFSRETDKDRDRSLTGANAMMGTPDYMAPEQARNAKSADIRADIYSLGCTFYYLLTGQPPFTGESIADLMFKHWEAPRPDVGLLRNDVPAELSQFIQKMMATEPDDRPQTPKEVVDWLTKFAKGGSAKKETVVEAKKSADEYLNYQEFTPEPSTPKMRVHQTATQPKKARPLIAGAVACVLVGLAILAASGVLRLKKDGTVVLENLPADAEVQIDGETAKVTSNGATYEIRVAADQKHRLQVKKDGFKVFGDEVEVDTGGRKSVVVRSNRWRAANVSPAQRQPGKVEKSNSGTKALDAKVKLGERSNPKNTGPPKDELLLKSEPALPKKDAPIKTEPPPAPITADFTENKTLLGHKRTARAIAVSPNGRQILSAGDDKEVYSWFPSSDKPMMRLGLKSEGVGAFFLPGGREAIVADCSRAYLIDLASNEEKGVFSVPIGGVAAIAGSLDGQHFASLITTGDIIWWNIAKKRPESTIEFKTKAPVNSVAVTGDGKFAAVGNRNDGMVSVWNLTEKKLVKKWVAHAGDVIAVAFSPDGKQLATVGQDNLGQVWNPLTGSKLSTLKGHTDVPLGVAFGAESAVIVTAGTDKSVRVWSSATGGAQQSFQANAKIFSLAVDPKSRFVAIGLDRGALQMFFLPTVTLKPPPKVESAFVPLPDPTGRKPGEVAEIEIANDMKMKFSRWIPAAYCDTRVAVY